MLRAGATLCFVAAAVFIVSRPAFSQQPAAPYEQICDIRADAALGLKDYQTAIRLHRYLLRSHPNDALAHYHLGFAYGMVGRSAEEIDEYQKAVTLGLHSWDLFLNLGLAYAPEKSCLTRPKLWSMQSCLALSGRKRILIWPWSMKQSTGSARH